jgi:hypothetical protein
MSNIVLSPITDPSVQHGLGRRSAAAALWCFAFSPSFAAAVATPTPVATLTATQIVDKHIAARGGLQAWRAVTAMSWSGKLEAGAGDSESRSKRYLQLNRTGKKDRAEMLAVAAKAEPEKQVQLPFTLAMERPRKSRLELEFAGKTAVQVYDGTNGWKLRPFLNRNDVEPFTSDEAKIEAMKDDLDGPLVDYVAKGTKVEFEAVEPVEGHDTYRLKLTKKSGEQRHVWIDAQSFLDVKVEGSARRMDGRLHNVTIFQRDFRAVQGVVVPFVLETAVEGYRDTHKMFIEKVAVNPVMNGAMFTKPGV